MQQEIEDFIEHDYAKVVAAVGIVTDEPELADEGVQSALIKVLMNAKQHEALAARVAIVATGEVRLIARRRENEAMAGVTSVKPELTSPPLVQTAPIVEAIRQLSQRQREMAMIYYYLGTSIPDLADVSFLNESTVETHIEQAKRSIAEYLVNAPKRTAPAAVIAHTAVDQGAVDQDDAEHEDADQDDADQDTDEQPVAVQPVDDHPVDDLPVADDSATDHVGDYSVADHTDGEPPTELHETEASE